MAERNSYSRMKAPLRRILSIFTLYFLYFGILLLNLAAGKTSDLAVRHPETGLTASTRIVSLAPSNTELVYSLQAGNELVAISDICDFPVEATKKEKVGNLRSVKMEKIAKLRPDLILLVNGQEVLAHNLEKHGFHTLILDNSSIENIGKNLLEIGRVSHKQPEAHQLSAAFEQAIQELKHLTSNRDRKQRVFICVWPQPLMSAGKGSYMNEGITIAGGINCTGDLPQAYPHVNQERLLLLQPDLIIVPQEQSVDKFWTKPPWTSIKAVKENHVYVLPQQETDCLNRPTLRFVDALYWLAIRLHPELETSINKWHAQTLKNLNR